MSDHYDFGTRFSSPLPLSLALNPPTSQSGGANASPSTASNSRALVPLSVIGSQLGPQTPSSSRNGGPQHKLAMLSNSFFSLQQICQTVIAQNDILVQRLLDLERLTAMRCDCSKLRAEVSDKNSQLKEARNQVAEMTKRLSQAQNQMNTMQQQQMHYNGVPMCIRCGQNERTVVSLPCAHVALCKGCSRYAMQCLLCGCHQQSTFDISFRRTY